MSAKILITKLLPILNRLVNAGVVSPQTLQGYVSEAMKRPTLSIGDVMSDLYGFDIPEDKAPAFAAVLQMLKLKKEEKIQ